ncbi:MAG: glycosyl transferase group 1 family protein [Burkholderiales bacterium]|jgi:glycosyltransferase involved in cell wall biosynthesis|nr:glycosyl transferase group 1 family protein [Burkholderiales bacterium]
MKNLITENLSSQKIKLIFSHFWGGGTELFLQDYLLDNELIILVRSLNQTSVDNIEIINNKKLINKYTFTEIDKLLNELSLLNIAKIEINHLMTLENLNHALKDITKYIVDNNIPTLFYLHDYFSLCPTINLLNNEGKFCELPINEEICNNCLSKNKLFLNYPVSHALSIREWREPFLPLLMACSKIYVFSDSSRKLLLKCYSDLDSRISHYALSKNPLPKIVNKVDFSTKMIINIGVLGVIAPTKGLWKLQELSTYIRVLNLPIRLTVIGEAYEEVNNAIVTGPYTQENLIKTVLESGVDLFIIPSICPETYCYTADEIMQMGYPIICFNIGAPPERVLNYKHGYVADNVNTYYLLEKIIEVAKIYNFKYFKTMNEKLLLDKLINLINTNYKEYIHTIQAQNLELHLKTQELQIKAQELQTVYNSNSWRITGPMRKIMRFLTNRMGKNAIHT